MLHDAWGNIRTSSGSAHGSSRFTGAEQDTTTGLYHMGARFYDPVVGRWLSEDPVQDKQFEPATLNFYAYVYDNPLLYKDPDGKVIVLAILEIGLTAYDLTTTTQILASNASTTTKVAAVALTVAGIGLPGGGYTAGLRLVGRVGTYAANKAAIKALGLSLLFEPHHVIPRQVAHLFPGLNIDDLTIVMSKISHRTSGFSGRLQHVLSGVGTQREALERLREFYKGNCLQCLDALEEFLSNNPGLWGRGY
jgi:RHS repeat-associated protein